MPGGLSELLLKLSRLAQQVEVASFQAAAFQLVGEALLFDSGVWGSGAMTPVHLTVHSQFLYHQPAEMLIDYSLVWQEDPLLQAIDAAKGRTINVASAASRHVSPAIFNHCVKYEIAYALSTMVIDPVTQLFSAISFYRGFDRLPFSEDDRQLIEDVMPHLIDGYYRHSIAQAVLLAQSPRPPTYFSAIADRTALLHFTEPSFTSLLRHEWDEWHGPHLPEILHAALIRQAPGRYVGNRTVILGTPLADRWLVRARPKGAFDSLGAREQAVARLYSVGLSRKEIARELAVSPSTVRNQLVAVFEKLQINDKAQLSRMLLQLE